MRVLEGGGRHSRRPSRPVFGAAILLVLLAGGVLLGAGRQQPQPPFSRLAGGQVLGPATPAAATATPTAAPAAPADASSSDTLAAAQAIVAPAKPPARLLIPAIGVDAEVESLGLDPQGRMATPSRADRVGWYSPGATPGDVGNAVIDGHLDWTDGPAVFWRLGRLKRGDRIDVVRTDGTRATFVVQSSSTTPYDASTDALFTRSGPPSLTLITCAGAWDRQRATYLQRLVVRASLQPPPPVPVRSPADPLG